MQAIANKLLFNSTTEKLCYTISKDFSTCVSQETQLAYEQFDWSRGSI